MANSTKPALLASACYPDHAIAILSPKGRALVLAKRQLDATGRTAEQITEIMDRIEATIDTATEMAERKRDGRQPN